MSTAFGPTTLVKALDCIRDFAGLSGGWDPVNYEQKHFVEVVLPRYLEETEKLPELEGRASTDIPAPKAWLKSKGFDIQLRPTGDADAFAVAAISDITVEWLEKAQVTTLHKTNIPAFSLRQGVILYKLGELSRKPLIELATTTGDRVFITERTAPHDWAEMLGDIDQFRKQVLDREISTYSGATIPMIKLTIQPDISWLAGLGYGRWHVNEALQEVRFGMNEHGARAKEATAMTMRSFNMADPKLPYEVTDPFYLWIERSGVNVPVFQAHITPDDWCNPGDLSAL